MESILFYIKEYLYIFPVVIISLTFHEFSHAYVATRLGDPTPRETGRLSLNPLAHLDPIGLIVMLLIRFGWAKPVQVNPLYFNNPRKGMMLTAIAGPVSNLILGTLSSLGLYFASYFGAPNPVSMVLFYMTILNVGLAVFNLIPIHPLDGSRVLTYFVPAYASFMARYGNYVHIAFIALLILPDYIGIPDIFGLIIGGAQMGAFTGLNSLWNLLFGFLFK